MKVHTGTWRRTIMSDMLREGHWLSLRAFFRQCPDTGELSAQSASICYPGGRKWNEKRPKRCSLQSINTCLISRFFGYVSFSSFSHKANEALMNRLISTYRRTLFTVSISWQPLGSPITEMSSYIQDKALLSSAEQHLLHAFEIMIFENIDFLLFTFWYSL